MPIKSFRGLIADGAIDTISLHTNDGSTGYKITKFQLMGHEPGNNSRGSYEHVVKIFKIPQAEGSATAIVDFADNTLLAAGLCFGNTSPQFNDTTSILFDNEIFNQDIFITHVDEDAATPVNYYIELEVVKLAIDENTVATLKDIRNIKA
tara:strand:+ start:24 stop:473 length:450 start_codon:yes stop_codon:yes gene_type:complete